MRPTRKKRPTQADLSLGLPRLGYFPKDNAIPTPHQGGHSPRLSRERTSWGSTIARAPFRPSSGPFPLSGFFHPFLVQGSFAIPPTTQTNYLGPEALTLQKKRTLHQSPVHGQGDSFRASWPWGRGWAGLQGAGGVSAPPGPLRRCWGGAGTEGLKENEPSGRTQGEPTKAFISPHAQWHYSGKSRSPTKGPSAWGWKLGVTTYI